MCCDKVIIDKNEIKHKINKPQFECGARIESSL
jgi:hypothetical protein